MSIKNAEIIGKLSISSKVALLTDGKALSSVESSVAGIPPVVYRRLSDVNETEGNFYPSFKAIANSWSTALIGKVTEELASSSKKNSVNMLITPDVRVKSSPYGNGISEDPFMARTYAGTFLTAIKNSGCFPCLSECTLEKNDAKFLDREIDSRFIHENFLKPFSTAAEFDGSIAVLTSYTQLGGAYADFNTHCLNDYLHLSLMQNGYVICDKTDKALGVESIKVGNTLTLNGDSQTLFDALENFRKVQLFFADDRLDADEEEQLKLNIEEKAIDSAVDKVIDFAKDCNGVAVPEEEKEHNREKLGLRAAEESIVLLKNKENILPLQEGVKVAVIGRLACSADFGSLKNFVRSIENNKFFTYLGCAVGYETDKERNEKLLEEAFELAAKSDVVLLFLGFDKYSTFRSAKLPANQLALCDAVLKANENVVGVVSGEYTVSMDFDEKMSAVILAPFDGIFCGEAILNVLSGKICPSGRLATTYYDDTDKLFNKMRAQRQSGITKAGTFTGYRNYDISGTEVKYPFGFGLSYEDIEYTKIEIDDLKIDVTLKNDGTRGGIEVVQLYIGKSDSKVLRPVKELKGFRKVFVKAGEEKTVRFVIRPKDLEVYDVKKEKFVVENGRYEVYIAASVSDVKLDGVIKVAGEELESDGHKLSDYVGSLSNVISNGYTLERVKNVKRRGKSIAVFGSAVAAVSLFMVLFLSMLGAGEKLIFSENAAANGFLIFFIAIALGGLFMSVFGYLLRKRDKNKAELSPIPEPVNRGVQGQLPYESLFAEQFSDDDWLSDESEDSKNNSESGAKEIKQQQIHYDKTLNFKVACNEFAVFSAERGLSVKPDNIAKIFASLASGRLILVKPNLPSLTPKFISILAEYLYSSEYVDKFKAYECIEDFLFKNKNADKIENTAAANAIEESAALSDTLNVSVLTDVKVSEINKFFAQFIKYVNAPQVDCSVMARRGNATVKYDLPPNIWFMMIVTGTFAGIDRNIADAACILRLELSETAKRENKTPVKRLGFHRFTDLVSEANKNNSLDEEKSWKKIDNFERQITGITPFSIGNRTWRNLENYASVYLACGGAEREALDYLVASKLLLSVIDILGKESSEKSSKLGGILGNTFGENGIAECRKILTEADVRTL